MTLLELVPFITFYQHSTIRAVRQISRRLTAMQTTASFDDIRWLREVIEDLAERRVEGQRLVNVLNANSRSLTDLMNRTGAPRLETEDLAKAEVEVERSADSLADLVRTLHEFENKLRETEHSRRKE